MGGMVRELAGKALVSTIVLRHHQQAAGHLVDPVDDTGPDLSADGGKVAEMVQERVHQRARFVPHRRMDHHPPRFVHHADIPVLVHDIQGDILGDQLDGLCLRNGIADVVPHTYLVAPFARVAVDQHQTLLDQGLHPRPGQIRQL